MFIKIYGAGNLCGYTDADQTLQAIPSGKSGVRETLRKMVKWVREYRVSPRVRQQALAIVGRVPQKRWIDEAEAVRRWVASNIRYTRDVAGVETLQTPDVTLRLRHGDCDDHAMLVAALLESIGAETRMVAIGAEPGQFDHVYAEVLIPGMGWLSAETTEPVSLGWVPEYGSRMVVSV